MENVVGQFLYFLMLKLILFFFADKNYVEPSNNLSNIFVGQIGVDLRVSVNGSLDPIL